MNETQEKIKMNQDIATQAPKPHSVARFSEEEIAASALHSTADLPSLGDAIPAPVPMSVEYWSPETEGETLRCWILGIEDREVADMETGELKNLESVVFVEQTSDGKIRRWFCASRILVANIRDAIKRGEIIPSSRLTPVMIRYVGLKKNARNAFKSKRFEILPLIVSNQ
jgi:hypothetical protein